MGGYALRPYQVELAQQIFEAWKDGNQRVMLQLNTAGGKTVTFGNIARQFIEQYKRVLILAHREELILQAADKVGRECGLPAGIVKNGYPMQALLPLQVASVQSLVRRLNKLPTPDLIVIDEAHHVNEGNTYGAIVSHYPKALVLGVTATPIRLDGKGFDGLFDELICGPSVKEMVADGYLSKFKLYADPKPMSTKGARKRGGDYSSGDIAKVNNAVELSGHLIESYHKYCPGKRMIVFAVNVQHSQTIAARYNAAGIPALHLDGNTPAAERRAALKRFAASEIKVLVNCQLFTEGFDLPELDAVQIARPTASLSMWLQMVGRVLRTSPEKEVAIILDHTKNWAIHGLPTRDRTWTLQGAEEPKERRVQAQVNLDGEVEEVEPLEIIEEEGELREIDEDFERKWEEEERWTEYNRLWLIQKEREYKKGWVAYKLAAMSPPFAVWQDCGKRLGYNPMWAWHKYNEQCERKGMLCDVPRSAAFENLKNIGLDSEQNEGAIAVDRPDLDEELDEELNQQFEYAMSKGD